MRCCFLQSDEKETRPGRRWTCGLDHASLPLMGSSIKILIKMTNLVYITSGTWGWRFLTPVGYSINLEFIYFLLEIFEYGVHALRRAPDPLKCLTFPLVGLLQGGPVNVPHQCFGLAQNLQCFRQHHHDKITWGEQNKEEKEKKAHDLWMWMHCEFVKKSTVIATAFQHKIHKCSSWRTNDSKSSHVSERFKRL